MVWLTVLLRIFSGITETLTDGLFWVVVLLVAVQHWRIAKNREHLFGIRGGSVILDTVYATGFGLMGGVLGSWLLVLTGVSLDAIGIRYLWPIALLLMLISPRFLCFAYAGGIIAIGSIIFGFPKDINVSQLIALVAILHLIESFLILVSGHRGAVPIYTKSKETETIVGGFTLQKFWPIPLMAMILVSGGVVSEKDTMEMPQWWPIIKPYLNDSVGKVYALIPVLAALGYGDLALARTPAQKSKISARNLSIYSLALLGLAMLSAKFPPAKLLAAVFAPLGHELVIYLGQKMELKERPIFIPPANGVMVLEAIPHTWAGDMGIKTGDIIYTINGIPVNSKADMEYLMALQPPCLHIEYVSYSSGRWHRKTGSFRVGQELGIIPVPEGDESSYMELNTKGFLHKLWKKLFH